MLHINIKYIKRTNGCKKWAGWGTYCGEILSQTPKGTTSCAHGPLQTLQLTRQENKTYNQ